MVRGEANKTERLRYTVWACGTLLALKLLDRVKNEDTSVWFAGKCLIGEVHVRFVSEDDLRWSVIFVAYVWAK